MLFASIQSKITQFLDQKYVRFKQPRLYFRNQLTIISKENKEMIRVTFIEVRAVPVALKLAACEVLLQLELLVYPMKIRPLQ
jgi:hypothetical protein